MSGEHCAKKTDIATVYLVDFHKETKVKIPGPFGENSKWQNLHSAFLCGDYVLLRVIFRSSKQYKFVPASSVSNVEEDVKKYNGEVQKVKELKLDGHYMTE